MIPEAGAFELIFLAAVALIVVGPKDLPVLMRKVGEFTRKMRGLADEFRHSFDEMARQSELDELRREVEALRENRLSDMNGGGQGGFTAVSDQLSSAANHAAYGDPEPAPAASLSQDVAEPAPPRPGPASPAPAPPSQPTPPAPGPTPEPARAEAHPLTAAEAK